MINDTLADILRTVQTPGDFCTSGSCPMPMPLIEVKGVGPIALPLLPAQAAQLVAAAERAPYGRGGRTLVDTDVRRTWQIGAARVRIAGKHWTEMLAALTERAAAGLGAGSGVHAELYKLLIYDEGSFFVSHRDTEKAPGMFATLIVALPSVHAGGELVVRHGEREVRLDLRCEDPSEAAFVAFYADCVHEVLPVTSGCRLVLAYNLMRKGRGRLPQPPEYKGETAALVKLLLAWGQAQTAGDAKDEKDAASVPAAEDPPAKLVYPLEHAYTPAELTFAALKGADAAAAGVLADAAQRSDCELHVALMQIDESGWAEHTGQPYPRGYGRYSHSNDDDDDDDDEHDGSDDEFQVGEVCDRALTLSHWSRSDGNAADLGSMPFEDAELCPRDALTDLDPDEQHFIEATGNEGASFERTYQRAALVLWPRGQRLALLARAGLQASLPYLADLVESWAASAASGAGRDDPRWAEAHALLGHMLQRWPEAAGLRNRNDAAAKVLSLMTRMADVERIDAFVTGISIAGRYGQADNAALTKALQLLPPARAGELLGAVIASNAGLHIAGCTDLLGRAAAVHAWNGKLQRAAAALVDALPGKPPTPKSSADDWRRERADTTAIHALLRALVRIDGALAGRAVAHVLAWPKLYGLDAVIVPTLRRLAERPKLLDRPALQALLGAGLAHLRTRAALPLAPPADWRREAALGCRCEHCRRLGEFLQDRAQAEWRFKARVSDREHLVDSIEKSRCDVDVTTERKGSPHVLVCTKNQASYEARVRQRRADLDDLALLG